MEALYPRPGAEAGTGCDMLGGASHPFDSFEALAAQCPPILALHWLRRSDWERSHAGSNRPGGEQ